MGYISEPSQCVPYKIPYMQAAHTSELFINMAGAPSSQFQHFQFWFGSVGRNAAACLHIERKTNSKPSIFMRAIKITAGIGTGAKMNIARSLPF